MNLYKFLKSIQDGVGDGCRVAMSLYGFGGYAHGVEVIIAWENDLRYGFVLLEKHLEDEGFLEHFSEYTIHNARKQFRIAEVGED